MDNYPVSDIIDQSISNRVNGMLGNRDVNLNTIVKMSMINELNPLDECVVNNVLSSICKNNKIEDFFIHQEYELTIDNCGNLVYIKNEKEDKNDPESIIPESS